MVWALMFAMGMEPMEAVLEPPPWASVMVFAGFVVRSAVEKTLPVAAVVVAAAVIAAAVIAGSGVSALGQNPVPATVDAVAVAPSF